VSRAGAPASARSSVRGARDPLDVICVGEALWDLAPPRGGRFARAARIELAPGGAAVNVALALARRGHAVGVAASVGADLLGDALVGRLAARGVDTAWIARSSARTGLVFVEHAKGALRVVSYRAPDEGTSELPRGFRARALVLTGVVPGEPQRAAFARAARAARRRGATVIADLNARPRMWRGASPEIPSWLGEVDVVKASEDDLATLGTSPVELRERLRRTAVLVVTGGGRAAVASGDFGRVELRPRASAGRPLGAGDAFTAGVVDLLLRAPASGASFWESALQRGHAWARRRMSANQLAR
jgi:sugar/nucleoside kinase (ribokinase family)